VPGARSAFSRDGAAARFTGGAGTAGSGGAIRTGATAGAATGAAGAMADIAGGAATAADGGAEPAATTTPPWGALRCVTHQAPAAATTATEATVAAIHTGDAIARVVAAALPGTGSDCE
jgi:hypothetical protein